MYNLMSYASLVFVAYFMNQKYLKNVLKYFSLQAGRNVRDLFEDLRDGHNLLSLLEVLSGEILVRMEKPGEKMEHFF